MGRIKMIEESFETPFSKVQSGWQRLRLKRDEFLAYVKRREINRAREGH
jgi:hypothetical protein